MSKSELQCAIEDAGYECRSYSGRGMMGKECLAVRITGTVGFLVADLIGIAYTFDNEKVADEIRCMRSDSLGKDDIIVFFPDVAYASEDSKTWKPEDGDE